MMTCRIRVGPKAHIVTILNLFWYYVDAESNNKFMSLLAYKNYNLRLIGWN